MQILQIFVIARRGPVESAFTLKELRDFSKMDYIDFFALKPEMEGFERGNISRPDKRKLEFMQKTFKVFESVEEMTRVLSSRPTKKRIIFRYLLSPTQILGSNGRISSAVYLPNSLVFRDGAFAAVKKKDGKPEHIESELLVKSVGFKSIKLDESVPFDPKRNIIPNIEGRVVNGDQTEKGRYVAGWIKTGPKGTIANTFNDCEETLGKIFEDIQNKALEMKQGG